MMTPERWQKVRDVLEQALELAPEKRARFLDVACSSDAAMRSEVQSLLSASEEARSSFLETPPLRASGLSPGIKLGDYEIVSQIGSGGMGVVYRARDVRLGRDVAIKVLPAHLSADPSRLKRFEQEAQSAASLNHPNILAVHQLGAYEGAPYLVSELLEGETLREELRQGALPQPRVLDYGEQIADGLSVAHERGIIHRDLKPENLFVTKDARVKILDFGLAKLAHGESDSAETLATLALQTHPGTIAGTVGYMSPEQVRGEKLDTRTDLFSFGVVLYEMATGKRPFVGDTSGVTFEAILNRQPTPPTKLNANVAPELERIIAKALEKDREVRYQHASDIRADLKRLKRDTESGHTVMHGMPAAKKSVVLRWLAGLAAIAVVTAGLLVYARRGTRSEGPKDLLQRDLTANSPDNAVGSAVISPDGKQLAYMESLSGLTLMQIDTGEKRTLPVKPELRLLGWYPDGTHLLLGGEAAGGMWKVSSFDGNKRQLVGEKEGILAAGISPDGMRIAFVRIASGSEIWTVGPDGENPTRLLTETIPEKTYINSITWSPTSQRIAYLWNRLPEENLSTAGLVTCNKDGTNKQTLLTDRRLWGKSSISPLAWNPDGRLIYRLQEKPPNGADSNLWAMKVDPNTGVVSGSAQRITNWTGLNEYSFSQSLDGKRLVFEKGHEKDDVMLLRVGKTVKEQPKLERVGNDSFEKRQPSWTADSETIVFASNPRGDYGVFEINMKSGQAQQLVSGPDRYRSPVVTNDGKWLLYMRYPLDDDTLAKGELMRMPLNGGPSSSVLSGKLSFRCAARAPVCVLSEVNGDTRTFSLLDPVNGRGEQLAQFKLMDVTLEWSWDLSPDGKYVAVIPRGLSDQIQILGLTTNDAKAVTVAQTRLQGVAWAPDGEHFYVTDFAGGRRILLVDFKGNFSTVFTGPEYTWLHYLRPSPDGRYLALTQLTFSSNFAMLENF